MLSLWVEIGINLSPRLNLFVAPGAIVLEKSHSTPKTRGIQGGTPPAFWFDTHDFKSLTTRWPTIDDAAELRHAGAFYTILVVPLSFLLFLTGSATAWLFHRDRRHIPPNHCPRCGYNLTGNTTGLCSECGTAISPPTPPSDRKPGRHR